MSTRTLADKVKYRKGPPAYVISRDQERANGFTASGRDCRGYMPMVEGLAAKLVEQAKDRTGVPSECWSLALRLAASALDKERRTA